MIKEMKKNNKMVLALVVIAALAMVSIAGIALHSSDDSSAAGTYLHMEYTGEHIMTIDDASTVNYQTSAPEGVTGQWTYQFVITANADFTGTLSIGTLTDDLQYTAYASIKLTDASAVNVTAILVNSPVTGGPVAIFMIGNIALDTEDELAAVPGGTYELTQGQLILGSATQYTNWSDIVLSDVTDLESLEGALAGTDNVNVPTFVPFTGTISAGDFSLTSSYVVGAIVALDSNGAKLSGYAASPNELKAEYTDENGDLQFPQGTLSLSGPVSIQYPAVFQTAVAINGGDLSPTFLVDSVDVTVEEGAVVTAGDVVPTVASDVIINTGDTVTTAWLIDSNGVPFKQGSAVSGGVEFTGVPFGTYTLIMNGSGNAYIGEKNVVVSKTGVTVGANKITSSSGFDFSDVTFAIGADTKTLEYDADTYYKPTYVYNLTQGLKGTVTSGVVTFSTEVKSDDVILAIMTPKTPGSAVICFIGTAGGSNSATGVTSVIAASASTPPAAGKLASPGTVTIAPSHVVFQFNNDSQLFVYGTMNFLYTDADNYGVLDIATGQAYLNLNIENAGLVSQGVIPDATGNEAEVPLIFGSDNLSAAYYYVNENSGTATAKSTYYFTSLENAINNSNLVYIVGDIYIKVNTTFDNDLDGDLEIVLTDGSMLQVGTAAGPENDPSGHTLYDPSTPDEFVSANLTIPETTTITVGNGLYRVINGEAIYDVQPEDVDEPLADVLIIGDQYIYTDVATACDISVSGDVLQLRQDDVQLRRDATLKTGVTLNDNGYEFTIPEEVTLTVSGTTNATAVWNIDGTLRVNNTANFNSPAEVNLNGTIDVTSTGTLNVKAVDINGPNATGVLNVDGTANLTGAGAAEISTIYVTGTLNITSPYTVTVTGDNDGLGLQVGATPELSPISATYTNTAVIKGKITLDSGVFAKVYGTFDGASVLNGTVVNTQYMIDDNLYLTLYAAANDIALPNLYETQLKDITINDWYNERNLKGDTIRETAPAHKVGDDGWKVVYADWDYKTYKIIFTQTNGVNWEAHSSNSSWSNTTDSGNNNGAGSFDVPYGTIIYVSANPLAGYSGTPAIVVGTGAPNSFTSFTNGGSFTVDHAATFMVTAGSVDNGTGNPTPTPTPSGGNNSTSWSDPMVILLIIVIIIIAIIAIVVAVRLLRS